MVVDDAYADASAPWPFQSPPVAPTSTVCCKQPRPPSFAGYGSSESGNRGKCPNRLGQSFYWRRLAICGTFAWIWLEDFELGAVVRWEVLLGDVFFTPSFCPFPSRST